MTAARKVFCIGFHKTGTTSLYAALRMLGFRVSGTVLHQWSAEQLARDGARACVEIMKDFDACEDMPWPHFYRALDAAYPGSKFILSTREADAWHSSVNRHFGHQETALNIFAYGPAHARAQDNRDHWIETMSAHNAEVRSYFSHRPDDFLEIDVTAGDGWAQLCPFLEKDPPAAPFPRKNTTAHRKSLSYRVKRKLLLLAGRTPHPERLL